MHEIAEVVIHENLVLSGSTIITRIHRGATITSEVRGLVLRVSGEVGSGVEINLAADSTVIFEETASVKRVNVNVSGRRGTIVSHTPVHNASVLAAENVTVCGRLWKWRLL